MKTLSWFDVVVSFQKLDKVAYRLGLLDKSESYATHPVVADGRRAGNLFLG
jgi:hypothetical protein